MRTICLSAILHVGRLAPAAARCSRRRWPEQPHSLPRQQRCRSNYTPRSSDGARPLEGYYADKLEYPPHGVQSATKTIPTPPPADELSKTETEDKITKARIVFGSRLAGPAERRDEIARESKMVAGVLVPPKPEEPDNCCMSGCVNCVWDRYGDEVEEWAAKSAEARTRMYAQRAAGKASSLMDEQSGTPTHVAVSMDDDGGGSEANWDAGEKFSADLFGDIPVGIREFMKTEKRLKQKHMEEHTFGG